MGVLGMTDVHRTARAAPLVRSALPVLLSFVDWQDVFERPALRTVFDPPIEVTLHAPDPRPWH
jgi:hypothetical protein